MTASNVGFQEVAELASHLSPEERLRLLAWIGAGLNAAPAESATGRLLQAPPRLSSVSCASHPICLPRMLANWSG